jgi:DNA invertase Pin-like site-specific DNA recombinase
VAVQRRIERSDRRSVPDARDVGDTLAKRGVSLSLGGQIHDPDDPMGKHFFNILATFAEFEVDLIRMRTREGMTVARAQGKLKGRQPKLSPMQQRELKRMHQTGEYTISDLGELFSVSRPTVYRTSAEQTHRTSVRRTVRRLDRVLSCDRRAALFSSRQVRREESRRAS